MMKRRQKNAWEILGNKTNFPVSGTCFEEAQWPPLTWQGFLGLPIRVVPRMA
jgi:hypothetical protein